MMSSVIVLYMPGRGRQGCVDFPYIAALHLQAGMTMGNAVYCSHADTTVQTYSLPALLVKHLCSCSAFSLAKVTS